MINNNIILDNIKVIYASYDTSDRGYNRKTCGAVLEVPANDQ